MFIIVMAFLSQMVFANSIDWSGNYRFESVYVKSFDLDSDSKNYYLHHLTLRPKIIAADGMHIQGRFDILNNDDSQYTNVSNAIGSHLGDSPSNNIPAPHELESSQSVSYINVSELYLTWIQEYGSLIVGRAPKDFGLGLNHSAGKGLFDHWFDTHDVVAYQIVMGNMFIKPYLAKLEGGEVNKNNTDTQEVGISVVYENLETDLKMGAVYEEKSNSSGVKKDAPHFGGDTSQPSWKGYSHENWNLYVEKSYGDFGFGLEIGFNAGDTGVINDDGEEITIDAFAVVSEFYYDMGEKWKLNLKAGMVTGDDPGTDGQYEGYLSDRNYKVGMLLFNHPLGKLNVTNTNYRSTYSSADVDSARLSNAIYFAPGFEYLFSDKWCMRTRLIYANLMEDPRGVSDADTDLGYELDIGFSYQPMDRVEVKLDTAYLASGDAFKGGTNNFKNDSIYGFEFGLAVRF